MATWIDFKELRRRVPIAEVLTRHGVELKQRGEKATCLCPLPTHPARADGSRRTASFSVHLGKGIWQCFGCGKSGNVLELYCRLHNLNPDDPAELRRAALDLAEAFGVKCRRDGTSVQRERASIQTTQNSSPKAAVTSVETSDSTDAAVAAQAIVNEPIDFELRGLDARHPYLLGRGFTLKTIEHFGLGFCARGMMKDRIAIPIHDAQGRLIAYAGRLADDATIDEAHPRYLFPGTRTYNGMTHSFRKSTLLYNLHRLDGDLSDLIVVEGFSGVWWLWQNGYANSVALMGSCCSDEQAKLIASHVGEHGRVWLMPDVDAAGRQLVAQALPLLAQRRLTRVVQRADKCQPTDWSSDDLRKVFLSGVTGTHGSNS